MNISLRPMVLGDWDFYRSLYMSPETMKFIAQPLTEVMCKKYFNFYFSERYLASKNQLFMIVATSESKEEIKAGIIQYSFKPKCKFSAEMGIMLSSGLTGHGVGKKANHLLFKKASEVDGLQLIYARIHVNNVHAHKLYRQLNFRQLKSQQKNSTNSDLWLADRRVFAA